MVPSGLSVSRVVALRWTTDVLRRNSILAGTRLPSLSVGTALAPRGIAAHPKPPLARHTRGTLAGLSIGTPRTVRPVPPGVLRHLLLVRLYTRWHTSRRVGDTPLLASISLRRSARSSSSLALISLTRAPHRRCACPWRTSSRAARPRAHTSPRSRWPGSAIRSRAVVARPATRTRSRTRRWRATLPRRNGSGGRPSRSASRRRASVSRDRTMAPGPLKARSRSTLAARRELGAPSRRARTVPRRRTGLCSPRRLTRRTSRPLVISTRTTTRALRMH